MTPLRPRTLARLALLALAVVLVGSGCAAEIGDSCSTNIDCSTSGDRICDTAQPDGYCTIEGCSANSCPEEGVCIRFFPAAFLLASFLSPSFLFLAAAALFFLAGFLPPVLFPTSLRAFTILRLLRLGSPAAGL